MKEEDDSSGAASSSSQHAGSHCTASCVAYAFVGYTAWVFIIIIGVHPSVPMHLHEVGPNLGLQHSGQLTDKQDP